MKGAVFCFLTLAVVALARPGEKYTDKFDSVDLDEIIENEKLLKAYVDCLVGDGRCTPDGNELKKNMPDALENQCAKCTEAQREGSRKMINYCIKHKPEYWAKLKAKYDPTGKYSKKYEDELKSLKS